MFLKCSVRRKDGKTHRSWSIVESRRHGRGKVAQRHVLYLGEINDSQRVAWERTIAVFDEQEQATRQLALFPDDREQPALGADAVQVRLDALRYHLDKARLRQVIPREGRYLLRTNLAADDPELIWRCSMQLCFVEEAFRTLKGDLGLRPIFHPKSRS